MFPVIIKMYKNITIKFQIENLLIKLYQINN